MNKLNITLQKARDGRDYIQIMSEDMIEVNIVLIANNIEINDCR
jgi:hypothetical protein